MCDQLRIISDHYFLSVGLGLGLYLAQDHINQVELSDSSDSAFYVCGQIEESVMGLGTC